MEKKNKQAQKLILLLTYKNIKNNEESWTEVQEIFPKIIKGKTKIPALVEILASYESPSSDYLMNCLTFITKIVVPELAKAEETDKGLIQQVLEMSKKAHGLLLPSRNERFVNKLVYLSRDFILSLDAKGCKSSLKMLNTVIEKKDVIDYNWSSSVLGAFAATPLYPTHLRREKSPEEAERVKSIMESVVKYVEKGKKSFTAKILKDIFVEKQSKKVKENARKFLKLSFDLVDLETVKSKIIPQMIKMYRKGGANITRNLTFLRYFRLSFLNKLEQKDKLTLVETKIFDGLADKSASVVNSSLDTLKLLLSLKDKEVSTKIMKSFGKKLRGRNNETLKLEFCKIMINQDLTFYEDESMAKTIVDDLMTAIDSIKDDETMDGLLSHILIKGSEFAKNFVNYSNLAVFLKRAKSDKLILAKLHLLQIVLFNIQEPTEEVLQKVTKVLTDLLKSELEPHFIKNHIRMQNNFIIAVSALHCFLTTVKKYDLTDLYLQHNSSLDKDYQSPNTAGVRLEGSVEAKIKDVLAPFKDNLFFFYTQKFDKVGDEIVNDLLFQALVIAGPYMRDIVSPNLDNLLLNLAFRSQISYSNLQEVGFDYLPAIRIGKALLQMRKLRREGLLSWDREMKETIIFEGKKGNMFDCLVAFEAQNLIPSANTGQMEQENQLSDFDIFALFAFISSCSQQQTGSVVQKFCQIVVNNNLSESLQGVFNFPKDIKFPARHFLFGINCLFSKHEVDRDFWSNFCEILLTLDPSIIFQDYIKFLDPEFLDTKKNILERRLMIELKNLDDSFYYLDGYDAYYEEMGYKEKTKAAPKPKGPKGGKKGKGGKKKPVVSDKAKELETREVKVEFKEASNLRLKGVNEGENFLTYGYYLQRLSDVTARFIDNSLESQNDAYKQSIFNDLFETAIFTKLKLIVSTISGLKASVKSLLITTLKNLMYSISSAEFSRNFARLFYSILQAENKAMNIRDTEEALDNLHNVRDSEGMHRAICPIFINFAIYCFAALFDGEARRKSFDIIQNLSLRKGGIQEWNHSFDFVRENLDMLRYEETVDFIIDLITLMKDEDDQLLNRLLQSLLDYQQHAVDIVLKVLLKMEEGVIATQEINQFAKIKLSILESNKEDEKTSELASKALQKLGGPLNYEQIMGLDFTKFLTEVPFDLQDLTASILNTTVAELDVQKRVNFFERVIAVFGEQIQKAKGLIIQELEDNKEINDVDDYVDVDQLEEDLKVFTVILSQLTPSCPLSSLKNLFINLIAFECSELPNLSDEICEVGIKYINSFPQQSNKLVEIFEENLENRQFMIAPIIFLGSAAEHLSGKSGGNKFKQLSEKILSLADQDNTAFQRKLGSFIPRLLIFFKDTKELVEHLLKKVQSQDDPVKIRGQCYAIIGMVRGLGVKHIDLFGIFDLINKIISSSVKKDLKDLPEHKRYFIAYLLTALWDIFGRIFEPKFSAILPTFMKLFGDNSEHIRNISTNVLNIAMKKMSGYGVKQMLPILLDGCKNSNWRTKLSNLAALGSMAHCASKQLASCLPQIVPQLTAATGDTNDKIQDASIKSLSLILSTIKSPEIMNIRDALIKALSNPFDENSRALDALLNTRFSHLLDAPSFALVVPVILYGLKNQRDNEQREKAAKVVANIAELVRDPEDISPYLKSMVEALRKSLSDITAETRATTAKAAGRLMRKLGRQKGEPLIRGLKEVLDNPDKGSIERSGAAQAICECMYALGEEHVENSFQQILQGSASQKNYVRESYLNMLVYLPLILDVKYEKYIPESLSASLKSIDHSVENIRSLAVRSIKIIIQKFSEKDVGIILRALFEGMFSNNYIKRNSSLVLIGETISIIFKRDLTKEEIYRQNARIFAALYIVKHDNNPDVKITGNNIWKTFAENTMTCLKQTWMVIVETIINLLLSGANYHVDISKLCMIIFISKYFSTFGTDIFKYLLDKLTRQQDSKFAVGVGLFLVEVLHNMKNEDFTLPKRKLIEELLTNMLESDDQSVWEAGMETNKIYYMRSGQYEFLTNLLQIYIEELEKEGEESKNFDRHMKFFKKITKYGLKRVTKFMESNMLTTDLDNWKLELIADTASVYAVNMYRAGVMKDGIKFFRKIYESLPEEEKDKKELILYTLIELVGELNEEHEAQLVNDSTDLIKKYISSKTKEFSKIEFALDCMTNYYEKSGAVCNSQLNSLFDIIVPLLTDTTDKAEEIFQKIGKFYQIILMPLTKIQCGEKVEYFDHSLQHKLRNDVELPGLNNNLICQALYHVVSKGLNIGDSRICEICIESFHFISLKLSPEMLQNYSVKILGSVLRACNYKHDFETKERILNGAYDILTTMTDKLGEGNIPKILLHQFSGFLIQVVNRVETNAKTLSPEEIALADISKKIIDTVDELVQDNLFTCKKWAKRVIVSPGCIVDCLVEFMEGRDRLSGDVDKVKALIEEKDISGVTGL